MAENLRIENGLQEAEELVLGIIEAKYDGDPVPYDDILQAVHPRFNGSEFEWPEDGWPDDPDDALNARELDEVLRRLVDTDRIEEDPEHRGQYRPR